MENNIRIEIFSKAEEDRKRRLEDPIVFRATKIGIVIVSMWGEEASDSMFDKHVIHHLNVSRCRNDYRAISV